VGVSPSRAHPVSRGRLCLKGWHAHELMDNSSRLTRPLVRRGGQLVEASWSEATKAAAQGLRDVLSSEGPEGVGVLGSARGTNEDNYVLARFARATLGTGNIDCSLRLHCFAEPMELNGALGPSANQGLISDLDDSSVILIVGGDPTEENPAVGAHVHRARARGAKVITAFARRHALGRVADVHLPVRPGAELRWVGSLLNVVLVEREGGDELAALRRHVAELTPERTEPETGVPAAATRRAGEMLAEASQAAIVICAAMALSPQGSEAAAALGALGRVRSAQDRPKFAVLSLLSRNNLQGCRDMGVTPYLLPGYGRLEEDADVERLQRAWGTPVSRARGLAAWEMLGRVKALYIMGDDPIRALPQQAETRAALEGLKFLVVQDIFMTPAAEMADVVFPAAAFGEREGTWTSLERRVQRVRKAVDPPGEAREDWRILADVSGSLGKPMPYSSPQDIFEEIVTHLPLYAGVFYPRLGVNGGVRWQAPQAAAPEAPAAAEAGFGEASAAAKTNEQRPLLLAADPTLGAWDGEVTVSRTLSVAAEFTVSEKDYPTGMLCVSPADAARFQLRSGRPARVVSDRGEQQMRVVVSDEVPEGVALVPYWQAVRMQVMAVVTEPKTGRPLLAPTPVSVEAPK